MNEVDGSSNKYPIENPIGIRHETQIQDAQDLVVVMSKIRRQIKFTTSTRVRASNHSTPGGALRRGVSADLSDPLRCLRRASATSGCGAYGVYDVYDVCGGDVYAHATPTPNLSAPTPPSHSSSDSVQPRATARSAARGRTP